MHWQRKYLFILALNILLAESLALFEKHQNKTSSEGYVFTNTWAKTTVAKVPCEYSVISEN